MLKRWRFLELLSFFLVAFKTAVFASFQPQESAAQRRRRNDILESRKPRALRPRFASTRLSAFNGKDPFPDIGLSLDSIFGPSVSDNIDAAGQKVTGAALPVAEQQMKPDSTARVLVEHSANDLKLVAKALETASENVEPGSRWNAKLSESFDAVKGFAGPSADTAENMHSVSLESFPALRNALQDTTNKLSSYSATSMDDILDRVKSNMQSSGPYFPPTTNDVVAARDDFADALTKQLSYETMHSATENLAEFSNLYVSSLDSRYHLSEFLEAAASGKTLTDSIDSVTSGCQQLMNALDLKHNAPSLLLIATLFWATGQKRVGIELGKTLSEERIQNIKAELKATKDAADEETKVNSAEIEELRQQMDTLQDQVEALTAAAQEVTKQLEQARALSANTSASQSSTSTGEKPLIGVKEIKAASPVSETEESAVVDGGLKTINGIDSPTESVNTKTTSKVKGEKATSTVAPRAKNKKGKVRNKKTSAKGQAPVAKSREEKHSLTPLPQTVVSVKKAAKKRQAPVAKSGEEEHSPSKKSKKKLKKVVSVKESASSDWKAAKKRQAPVAKSREEEHSPSKKSKEELKKVVSVKESTTSDWGMLAESTLKRKTVKELTGYLAEKGVECTDTNGKILKKDSLVGLVLSN